MSERKRPVNIKNPAKQAGYGLMLLVLTMALLIIGITAFMSNDDRSTTQLVQADLKFAQISSQSAFIRQRILQCALEYPSGDNGTVYHKQYPAAATIVTVATLTCPGAPVNRQPLWNGTSGAFMPKQVSGFNAWNYINDASGIRVSIESTGTTSSNSALNRVLTQFNSTEASLTGNVLTLWIIKN